MHAWQASKKVGEETFLPSYAFPSLPSPPLPFFTPAQQGQESPFDGFLTGTLFRFSETVDFSDKSANFF